jgi:hypothetical protein
VQSLETALCGRRSERCPGPYRPRDAFEILCSEVLKLEQVAKELSRILSANYAVRLRNALQASREVRGLAYNATFLSLA